MTALLQLTTRLADRPILCASSGAASGLITWLITYSDHVIRFVQLVGGLLGMTLTLISLVLVSPRVLRFVRAWRTKGFTQADQ